jgi:hypothetical protein
MMCVTPLLTNRVRSSRFKCPAAIAVAVALGLGMAAAPARADIVTSTFSDVNPGEVATISSTNPNIGTLSGWAGVYNFTNATGAITGDYSGFCIDIAQDIYGGQTVTFTVAALSSAPTPGNPMGQLRANLIGELWYNDYSSIGSSNTNAAAFQLAIWEIINEQNLSTNGLNLTNGTFQTSAAYSSYPDTLDQNTISLANNWLAALDMSGNGNQASNLVALTSDQYQDYIVQVTATPAPPGLVLGVIGGLNLMVTSLWCRRKASPAACA